MAGHLFEPVRGKRAHHKIVAAHRIQGINQLATSHAETLTVPTMRPCRSRLVIRLQTFGRALSSEQQRDLEYAGAVFQVGQIESHQIVVLDRIRVTLANKRTERGNQGRLLCRGSGFQHLFKAPVIANGDEEDAASCRIEGGRFEIELQAMQVVDRPSHERRPDRCS